MKTRADKLLEQITIYLGGLDGSRHILSSISICRSKSLVQSTRRLLCSIAPIIKPIKSKIPPQPRIVLPIIRDWLGELI